MTIFLPPYEGSFGVGADTDSPGTANMVAWWSMNDTDYTDAHGSNDLTESGAVANVSGLVGNAASFASVTSDALYILDNADISVEDIDFWVGGWFYPTELQSAALIFKADSNEVGSSTNIEYAITMNSDAEVGFTVADGTANTGNVNCTDTVTTDAWYLVIAYHSATSDEIGISVNNGAFTTAAYSAGGFNGTGQLEFGRKIGTEHYDGDLDQWFLYKNNVPTSDNRAWLYNSGAGRRYAEMST
jgi:hypothetical protein